MVRSGGGGGVLVGSAGELHGSLLQLGVEEDEVRKVSRRLSIVRWQGNGRRRAAGPLRSSAAQEKWSVGFVTWWISSEWKEIDQRLSNDSKSVMGSVVALFIEEGEKLKFVELRGSPRMRCV
jgi:hypothetical protein